jgi:hypothetical protein
LQSCVGLTALLVNAPVIFGQHVTTDSLVRESVHVNALGIGLGDKHRWIPFRSALRDWIEARLQSNLRDLGSSFPRLKPELTVELKDAGLMGSDGKVGVDSVELVSSDGLPRGRHVKASIDVPCGVDTSVYVYRFGTNGRVRLLAAEGKSDWGDHV